MINISRSIKIQAPIHRVLDCLDRPQTSAGILFNFAEIRNIRQLESGTRLPCDRAYSTQGLHLAYATPLDDQSLSGQWVTRSHNGANSTITWAVYVEGHSTQVTLRLRYQLPASLLKTQKEQFLLQQCVCDLDTILSKLKSYVELSQARAAN